jgi:hypothetical protein
MDWLKKEERKLLLVWCLATFGHRYSEIIMQMFRSYVK